MKTVYVVRDGEFTLSNGIPASNIITYDAFSKRYLLAFDKVVMVGRLFPKEDPTAEPTIGPGVEFVPMPGYHGPLGFIKALPKIWRTLGSTIDPNASYILRVPTTIACFYSLILALRGIKFGVEVAADPLDAYSPEALKGHKMASFFRWCFVKLLLWQCKSACATAYVTRAALQKRYPPGNSEKSFSFTSIDLHPVSFVSQPRIWEERMASSFTIVANGHMQNNIKGHDTLFQAMNILVERGLNCRAKIIGFGGQRAHFEKMASDMGLTDRVEFTGKLPTGGPVRDVLDSGDIFVLPSRQEGLPRAMIEAMARGLPCIGSTVGGIPELIPYDLIIEPGDASGLAEKIYGLAVDSGAYNAAASRNLSVAQSYAYEAVTVQRKLFYSTVRDAG